jgi:acyl-CoA thioester hydrolase
MMNRFIRPLTVLPEHIDRLDHVNNVEFVRMIQEVATEHWLSKAPDTMTAHYTWVCRRHEIDYLKQGKLSDELELQTWVGEPSGATWERFTEIHRPADGAILVTARTVWVLLDAVSGRPRRIDAAMRAILE